MRETRAKVAEILRDGDTAGQAQTEIELVRNRRSGFSEWQRALSALREDPRNASARATAGRYAALLRRAWTSGLKLLETCDVPELREAASLELRTSSGAVDWKRIGDAWWEACEIASKSEREALRTRAGLWYARSLPQLDGSDRARVLARLRERGWSGRSNVLLRDRFWDWGRNWVTNGSTIRVDRGEVLLEGNPSESGALPSLVTHRNDFSLFEQPLAVTVRGLSFGDPKRSELFLSLSSSSSAGTYWHPTAVALRITRNGVQIGYKVGAKGSYTENQNTDRAEQIPGELESVRLAVSAVGYRVSGTFRRGRGRSSAVLLSNSWTGRTPLSPDVWGNGGATSVALSLGRAANRRTGRASEEPAFVKFSEFVVEQID